MKKLLLLSIMFASVALPARAATAKNPRAGLKKALVNMMVFNAVYLFALLYVYGRL